jgi:hypothetical protein
MAQFWSTLAGLDIGTPEHHAYQLEELVMPANGSEICRLVVCHFSK